MPAPKKGSKKGLVGVLLAGVAGVAAAIFLSDKKNREMVVDQAKKITTSAKKTKTQVAKKAKKVTKKIVKKVTKK